MCFGEVAAGGVAVAAAAVGSVKSIGRVWVVVVVVVGAGGLVWVCFGEVLREVAVVVSSGLVCGLLESCYWLL